MWYFVEKLNDFLTCLLCRGRTARWFSCDLLPCDYLFSLQRRRSWGATFLALFAACYSIMRTESYFRNYFIWTNILAKTFWWKVWWNVSTNNIYMLLYSIFKCFRVLQKYWRLVSVALDRISRLILIYPCYIRKEM